MKNKQLRWIYFASDLLMSFVGVVLFDIIRYYNIPKGLEPRTLDRWLFHDGYILGGLIVFPLMMVTLYAISGYYNNTRAKSRLDDFRNAFFTGFVGMLLIYFIILINDYLPERIHNYELLGVLWLSLSVPVWLGRSVITALQRRRLKKEEGCYRAVIIGTPQKAGALVNRLSRRRGLSRYRIERTISPLEPLDKIVAELQGALPDSILVTPHPDGVQATAELIDRLYPLGPSIHITPDLYQLLTSRARVTDVVGEPLIDITNAQLSPMTTNMKRIADVVGSALAMVVLSPVYAAVALAIKLDSPGKVFYTQERIGYHKRPFKIIKFRTMRSDSEPNGPELSSVEDPRITRVGHFLRKYRLDELPQFLNIIRGDMSLVGPRPERRYFVDKIVERVPHYSLIHQVRPGLTSWGMVKYGYASNVDEMVERLYYDLLYIENVSFSVDMKILFHTLNTVVSGRGM